MKNKYKFLLPLYFCTHFLFGQWHQITIPPNYFGNYSISGFGRYFSVSSNYNVFFGWGEEYYNGYAYFRYGVDGTTDDFNTSYGIYFTGQTSPTNFGIHALDDSTCEISIYGLSWGNKNGTHNICNNGTPLFFPVKSLTYEVTYNFVSGTGYAANIYLADTTTHTVVLKDSIPGTAMYYSGSDLYFTNDSTGYFLNRYWNGNSFIKKTTNFGASWVDVLNCVDTLQALYFPTRNTGYAVGDSGVVYKTVNAGVSWNKVNIPVRNNLFAVYFLNNDTGYVGGAKGILYKTLNGGITWNAENSNDTNSIIMLKMVDDSTAYFADYANLYKNNYYNATSIKGFSKDNSITIFPNPTSNFISVNIAAVTEFKNSTVTIQNILGEEIKKLSFIKTIDVSDLSQGCYFIQVTLPNGENYKTKFIKQ